VAQGAWFAIVPDASSLFVVLISSSSLVPIHRKSVIHAAAAS
jgi:hypothetical protein